MIKLQCTDHTFYIVCMDCIRTCRIYFFQPIMKILSTFCFRQFFQLCTVSVFLLRLCKINISGYRLNIKSGSSDQNRYLSFFIDFLHSFFCHLLEFYDMKFFFRFQNIHQIMLYSLHFLRTDLRRTDIHFFIYLHGICRNNLTVYRLCQ